MIIPWTNTVNVSDDPFGTQTNPQVTTLANGNYVVVWHDQTDDTINFKIYDSAGVEHVATYG